MGYMILTPYVLGDSSVSCRDRLHAM